MHKSSASPLPAAPSRYSTDAVENDSPQEPPPPCTPAGHPRESVEVTSGAGSHESGVPSEDEDAPPTGKNETQREDTEAEEGPTAAAADAADAHHPSSCASLSTPSRSAADNGSEQLEQAEADNSTRKDNDGSSAGGENEDDDDDDVCAETDTQSSSTRHYQRLSALQTNSSTLSSAATGATTTVASATTATTPFSSNSLHVSLPPRAAPQQPPTQQQKRQQRPTLSVALVALSRETPSPPLPPQSSSPASVSQPDIAEGTRNGDDASNEDTMDRPPVVVAAVATATTTTIAGTAPRSTQRCPPMGAPTISTYKSVLVLPPQVFRSASSTTTSTSPGTAGAAIVITGGGNGNSATSTPMLSPPQQCCFGPSSTSAGAWAAAGGPTGVQLSSPLMRAVATPHTANFTGVLSPVSSTAGLAVASAFAASSPTHLPVRLAYSLGGSRKRNSVSVPTNAANLCSEDDDNANSYVVDDNYQSTDQWPMLSQSTSNACNNTMMSTAVTSRSSSRDLGPTEESGTTTTTTATASMTMIRSTNSNQANYSSGSTAANNYQLRSMWPLMKPQSLTDPRLARSGTGAQSPTASPSAVSDPSPVAPSGNGSASTVNTPTRGNAAGGGHTVGRSRDHSFTVSLRSPLQSPPTTAVHCPAGRGGGTTGSTTLLSRRGSLSSLRPITHDPYNAAIMSPAVVPRTGSLSSLRSPSAPLTSPTAAAIQQHASNNTMMGTSVLGTGSSNNSNNNNTAAAAMAPSPFDAVSPKSNQLDSSRGGLVAMTLSQSGHEYSNNTNFTHSGSNNMSDQFLHSNQNPSFVGSSSSTVASFPPYLQQLQQQQAPLSFSPSTAHLPPAPPPRRRTAQEVLTGFFSEVPIELGEQTHLALDRNGVPYHNGTTMSTAPSTTVPAQSGDNGSTNNGGTGGSSTNPYPLLPPTADPSQSVYTGMLLQQQQPYYYSVESRIGEPVVPQESYAPYPPSASPSQLQQQHALPSNNPVTAMMHHRPLQQSTLMDGPSMPLYKHGDDSNGNFVQLRSTSVYSYPGVGAFPPVTSGPASRMPSESQFPHQQQQQPVTSFPPMAQSSNGQQESYTRVRNHHSSCVCDSHGSSNNSHNRSNLYSNAVYCTELDSHACPTAYGSASGGISMTQLYPMDSVYTNPVCETREGNPVLGVTMENSSSNNNAVVGTTPAADLYRFGSNFTMPSMTGYDERGERRRICNSGSSSCNNNFVAPLPRSVAAVGVNGGGTPMNSNEAYQNNSNNNNNGGGVQQLEGECKPALTEVHHIQFSPFFPPVQERPQQKQQQTSPHPLSQSYPSVRWNEVNNRARNKHQQQASPRANDSVLSACPYPTIATSTGPSASDWDSESRNAAGSDVVERRILPQMRNSDRGMRRSSA